MISGLAVDPRNFFVSGSSAYRPAGVAAIDPRTNTVGSSVLTGQGSDGIAWDGVTGQFWVANLYSQSLSWLRP